MAVRCRRDLYHGYVCGHFSQPSPRPLSPDFLKRREAGSAFQLGRLFLKQGKADSLQRAVENFENAVRLYGELGDGANVGCSLLGIGAVQAFQGQNSAAARSYQEAIAIFGSLKGRDLDESVLSKLGFLYDESTRSARRMQRRSPPTALC